MKTDSHRFLKKSLKLFFLGTLLCGGICILTVAGINWYILNFTKEYIFQEVDQISSRQCAMILGARVYDSGTISLVVRDRVEGAMELYHQGLADKVLISGDHGQREYDEVNAIKNYIKLMHHIPDQDIFMDHAGFSTYDSVYRARDVFDVDKMIIVSQGYHLYRALYIAQKLGVDAYGVAADYHIYRGQTYRDLREILARVKDAVITVFKPEPTYLGKVIPVSGDGDLTND